MNLDFHAHFNSEDPALVREFVKNCERNECITALWETGYDRTLSFESSFPAESMTDSFRFSAIFWRAAEKIAMRRLNYKKGA